MMITKFFDAMFGCWHNHYSFPRTVRSGMRRNAASQPTGTYVVCLDCGKELPYDWSAMKIMTSQPVSGGAVPALAAKEAA